MAERGIIVTYEARRYWCRKFDQASGASGIFLGFGIAKTITLYARWETGFSRASVLIAVGTSAAVGLLFGLFPARRAAQLDPMQTLRFE